MSRFMIRQMESWDHMTMGPRAEGEMTIGTGRCK